MNRIIFVLWVIGCMLVAGCTKPDKWEGFVYPDKHNTLIRRSSGNFPSLDECKNSSMAMLESLVALDKGYYDCGKNCKPGGAGFYKPDCEELVRGNLYR